MNCQRGARTFNRLIMEGQLSEKPAAAKGRGKDLIAGRNMCLLHRYYYYVKLLRLRYDVVMGELQKEFFLSRSTIPRIIEQEIEQIRCMVRQKLTPKQLTALYPQFSWSLTTPHKNVKAPKREIYKGY